jgi:hypothetical protein
VVGVVIDRGIVGMINWSRTATRHRTTHLGRPVWRAALVLALLLAVVGGAPVAATASPSTRTLADRHGDMTKALAVDWAVDHDAKTITVTVRLQLGSACTRGAMARATTQGPAAVARCRVTPEVVQAIKDDVDRVWNNGLKYFCYTFKVVMDITVVDGLAGAVAGSKAAPADRHFIAIDQSAADVRSSVTSYGPAGGTWDGTAAGDRISPYNDVPGYVSTWKYPATWEQSLYAHEVGHVIGLSDAYVDVKDANGKTIGSQIRDGAPDDVMSDVTVTNVDTSTLNRLVRRAGINPFTLKCDWTVDRVVPGGKITGTKCGGVEGDWVIKADITSGPAHIKQTWTVTILLTRDQDTFVYEDSSLTQVPYSKTTTKGESSGNADLSLDVSGGTSASMALTELKHTSSGTTTAAGRTLRVPTSDVPLVNYEFTWLPTVCGP